MVTNAFFYTFLKEFKGFFFNHIKDYGRLYSIPKQSRNKPKKIC